MSGAWKGAHIRPDFGDDGLYRNPAPNARNLSSNCSIHSQPQQQPFSFNKRRKIVRHYLRTQCTALARRRDHVCVHSE